MKLGYFPVLRSGESVYSVCARYHWETGGLSPETTSRSLFGSSSAHRYTDTPVCLDHLQMASHGSVTASEGTIRSRSGLGPYLALMSPDDRISFIHAACGAAPAVVRSRSGLNRYVGSVRLLKFCRLCLEEQERRYESGWWIAAHQIPGVWFCEHHRCLLAYFEASARADRQWLLPHVCSEVGLVPPLDSSAQLQLLRVENTMRWIATAHHLDTSVLQVLLKTRLHDAGFCRSEVKCKRPVIPSRRSATFRRWLECPATRQNSPNPIGGVH